MGAMKDLALTLESSGKIPSCYRISRDGGWYYDWKQAAKIWAQRAEEAKMAAQRRRTSKRLGVRFKRAKRKQENINRFNEDLFGFS